MPRSDGSKEEAAEKEKKEAAEKKKASVLPAFIISNRLFSVAVSVHHMARYDIKARGGGSPARLRAVLKVEALLVTNDTL